MPKLNLDIHPLLKKRLDIISRKYGLPKAEIVRMVLKTGLPLLEGILEAQAGIVKEVVEFRQVLK